MATSHAGNSETSSLTSPGAGRIELATLAASPLHAPSFASLSTAPPASGPLIDQFGRIHKNLRISVTDRCNIRCTYCMPETPSFLPSERLLSPAQIEKVAQAGLELGLDKIRLTGGEPLLRPELVEIVTRLRSLPGLQDLSLTTNGMLLGKWARPLKEAGLDRLTISLDTLNEERFQTISRRPGLSKVLEGIAAAKDAGFTGIKLNAVILRGVNEADILPLVHYARKNRLVLRFIESMPIGAEAWDRARMISGEEILATIQREFGPLVVDPAQDPHAPSLDYLFQGERENSQTTKIGLISAVSRPFCRQCDRLRLTADGNLRNCLFSLDESDLKPALLENSESRLEEIFRKVVWSKWEGHEINTSRFLKPERTMHAIGG